MNEYERVSKLLSHVLRHEPEFIDIHPDNDGWTDITLLLRQLQIHGTPLSREMLEQIVQDNTTDPLLISSDGLFIRAAQGHCATQTAIDHPPQTPPDILFHGTAISFISDICELGLIAGKRNNVHLSADKNTALEAGARHGDPVVLTIASGEMFKTGYPFYLADDGVWQTPHVPIKYFS